MSDEDIAKIRQQFKFVCRKCGSENVTHHVEEGYAGSEWTGWCGGSISLGCADCNQNDITVFE